MRSRNEAQLHRPRRTRRHHRRTRLVRSSLNDCRSLPRKIRTLVVELPRREGSLGLATCGLPRRHGRVQRSRYSRKLRKGRMKTRRYKEGDEADRKGLRHLMPTFPDDPASRFLDYYQRYLIAKGQQNGEMIWLCAVVCRIISPFCCPLA